MLIDEKFLYEVRLHRGTWVQTYHFNTDFKKAYTCYLEHVDENFKVELVRVVEKVYRGDCVIKAN